MLTSAKYLRAENEYAILKRLIKRLEATANREMFLKWVKLGNSAKIKNKKNWQVVENFVRKLQQIQYNCKI